MNKVIYISGKISGGNKCSIEEQKMNISNARQIALVLWKLPDVYILCPHINSPWNTEPDIEKAYAFVFKGKTKNESYDEIIKKDIGMLDRVDALFMLHNWTDSEGAKKEHDYAKTNNIPVFYTMHELIAFTKTKINRCFLCKKIRNKLRKTLNIQYCNQCFKTIHSINVNESEFFSEATWGGV